MSLPNPLHAVALVVAEAVVGVLGVVVVGLRLAKERLFVGLDADAAGAGEGAGGEEQLLLVFSGMMNSGVCGRCKRPEYKETEYVLVKCCICCYRVAFFHCCYSFILWTLKTEIDT